MTDDLKKEISSLKSRIDKLEKSLSSKNSMFGKPQNELGSTKSETVISTLGTLKVKYGSKYVTIFKDGKLVSGATETGFIYKSDHIGTQNGIYVIEQEDGSTLISLVLEGKSYEISTSADTYVSFIDAQNTSSEQKDIALKNIGIVYPTLREFYDSGINNGIIFISDEGKLYLVRNGQEEEFKIEFPEELNVRSIAAESIKLGSILLTESEILLGGVYRIGSVIFSTGQIDVPTISCSNIVGKYFSIIESDEKSTLTVDNIIVKNPSISQVPRYTTYDTIVTIEESDEGGKYIIQLSSQIPQEGDIILTQFQRKDSAEKYFIQYEDDGNITYYTGEDLADLDWNEDGTLVLIDNNNNEIVYKNDGTPVPKYLTIEYTSYNTEDYLFKHIGNSVFESISPLPESLSSEIDQLQLSFAYLVRRSINGENVPVPLTSIKDEIKVFIPQVDEVNGKIISMTEVVSLKASTESCGLLLHKPEGMEQVKYAMYTKESAKIPLNADDTVLTTISWVKEYLGNFIPEGSIMAFHGDSIPEGWAICDGQNGTPNLVGKFLIGGTSEQEGDEISITPTNAITGTETSSVKIDPKYYSLVFIMKIQ